MKTTELHPTFFFPKPETMVSFFVESLLENEELKFMGDSDHDVHEMMDFILMKHYHNDGKSGRIHTQYLFNAVKELAKSYEMMRFFNCLSPTNKWGNWSESNIGENEVIAIGVLDEDYDDGDPDPYMTAGGYRSWKATKGTVVKYYLNSDLSVTVKFDSNCIVDHYNNNFGGVSTGGGTTNYKIGERVETRSFKMGREFVDKDWTKTNFKATVTYLDILKVKNLIVERIPEFSIFCK